MQGYFGIYRGTVVNNADPEHLGRLLLQVPAVTGFRQSSWAASSRPAGAAGALPDPGAAVWVMYESGDTTHPVWVGVPGWAGSAGPVTTMTLDTLTVLDSVTLPAGSLTVATTAGLQAALDSKYSSSNPPPVPPPPDLSPYLTSATAAATYLTSATAATTYAPVSTTVTLAGAQTISGAKTFSTAPAVPDASWAIAKTSGLQAALDAKYSASNPPPGSAPPDLSGYVTLAGTQTISGNKTFSGYLGFGGAAPSGGGAASLFSAPDAYTQPVQVVAAAGSVVNQFGIYDNALNSLFAVSSVGEMQARSLTIYDAAFATQASISATGRFDAKSIYDNGNRVYSASNPPTAPTNMVTTDGVQTITAAKTFSGAFTAVNAAALSVGTGAPNIGTPKGIMDIVLGNGSSTNAYTSAETSGGLRFNGAGVYWGDLGYYPNGGTTGEFRFLRSNNAFVDGAGGYAKVRGDFYDASGNRVYSASNPPPASGMTVLGGQQAVTNASSTNTSSTGITFVAPASGRVVIRGAVFPPVVASSAVYDFSASLDNSTWYAVAVESRFTGSSASIFVPNAYGQATFTGLTPGATYTVYYKSPNQLSVSISYSVEG